MDKEPNENVGDIGNAGVDKSPVLLTKETKSFVVDPTDEAVRNPPPGSLIPVKLEDLEKLVALAQLRMKDFDALAPTIVPDVATAKQVKAMRQAGYTWRALASECHDRFNGARHPTWYPPSNQLMGVALCNRAASLLGESPDSDPWQ